MPHVNHPRPFVAGLACLVLPVPLLTGLLLAGLLLAGLLIAGPSAAQTSNLQKQSSQPAKRAPITTRAELAVAQPTSANPYVAFLPADVEPDFRYWNARLSFDAQDRRAARGFIDRGAGIPESEPNDTSATADPVPNFGTGAGEVFSTQMTATIAAPSPPSNLTPSPEDEGSITLATATGLASGNAVSIDATLGDGPYGSSGTGSGDFDFYAISATAAGQTINADITVTSGSLDSFLVVWDSAGEVLAFNDDANPPSLDSALTYSVPGAGTYYVSVGSYNSPAPDDPFDSSSGLGANTEGPYNLLLGLDYGDRDYFSVELEAGDILGVASTLAAPPVSILDVTEKLRIGSSQDLSGIFPGDSSLSGSGGPLATFVAEAAGTYYILASSPVAGAYNLELEVYRPPTETVGKQVLFVDFDGATVDPAIFGGFPGSATLSPLVDFLSGWGLTPANESAVIDSILASLEETLDTSLDADGNNPFFDVEILNSRDHADPFGAPNVSRLIVGGTIDELGIETIGIAQSIDPGNFDTSETAVILLDLLSDVSSNLNSLNSFTLAGGATIIDLIGTGVGNITAHEAGHYLGNFHTEQFVTPPNIMDQGGNLANSVGLGANTTFGDGDDVDVDFIEDVFVPSEGLSGSEDTLNVTAFGLSSNALFLDTWENGDTSTWSSSVP